MGSSGKEGGAVAGTQERDVRRTVRHFQRNGFGDGGFEAVVHEELEQHFSRAEMREIDLREFAAETRGERMPGLSVLGPA